jgi:bifunctional DNase/RNase
MSNSYIKLTVVGLTYSQTQSAAYALVLGEENGVRRIPIIIGSSEAQSIAMHLQGVKSSRPLTHDLFVTTLEGYQVQLKSVVIYKMEKEIFYSELFFENNEGKTLRLDSRTSDAVALAVRAGCPIFTTFEIMEKAGVVFEEETDESMQKDIDESEELEENKTNENKYADFDDDELQQLLNKAIKEEDYERATLLRDEIKKRTKKL